MKAKTFTLILLLAVGCFRAWGDEPTPKPELWFPVGEQLTYRVYWGIIPVATAEATSEWVEEDGRLLLAIRYRTRSNKVIAQLYPVDDFIESIVDPETFLPVRFTKNLAEGRYRAHEITTFDYEAGIAHWYSVTRDNHKTFDLEPGVRDLVSFSYYMRNENFKPNTKFKYRVMADDKIYDLWINTGDRTRVKLPKYGKVSSIPLDPEAAFEGLFVRSGKITLWVSEDKRCVLTQMVGKIPVASIRLVLYRVRGPGNDAWILNGDGSGDDDHDDEDASEERPHDA